MSSRVMLGSFLDMLMCVNSSMDSKTSGSRLDALDVILSPRAAMPLRITPRGNAVTVKVWPLERINFEKQHAA